GGRRRPAVHHEVERWGDRGGRGGPTGAPHGPFGSSGRGDGGGPERRRGWLRRRHHHRRGRHQRGRQPDPGRRARVHVRRKDRRVPVATADRGHPHHRGGRRQRRHDHHQWAAG